MSTIVLRHSLQKGDFRLDVDTQIPGSGVTGVFGESGSGKTTLLRCIAGLERSTSDNHGRVHQRRIGFVFQRPRLFDHLNVRRNIEYGKRRCTAPTTSLHEVAELLELTPLLERRTSTLSGGEAQRVSIARALCQSPRLILMDEPLSGLDERRKEDLLPYLDRLHAEASVPIVYVSHNIDEICRLSDHLLLIENGRIVAEGDLQETLTRLDLPQLAGRNAGTVLEAQRSDYDVEFDLTLFAFPGGEIWVPGEYEPLAARLRVSASDVSVSVVPGRQSSILNSLPAIIDAMQPESRSTLLLRLQLGNSYLVARITARSWQQLGLQIGDSVFAQVKSVTVRR